jgi:hypothetical protein
MAKRIGICVSWGLGGWVAVAELPIVVTETVTDAGVEPESTIELDDSEQVEPVGAPLQDSATVWLKPAIGLTASEYVAVEPGVTVCVDEEEVNEKSSPEPLSGIVCGLPLALSAMVSVPLTAPLFDGSKNTPIAQLDPAARLPPQALSTPKSLELVVTLVMVRGALPGFVAVTVSGKPEVPTYWPGNVRLDGDNVRVGPVITWLSDAEEVCVLASPEYEAVMANVPAVVNDVVV